MLAFMVIGYQSYMVLSGEFIICKAQVGIVQFVLQVIYKLLGLIFCLFISCYLFFFGYCYYVYIIIIVDNWLVDYVFVIRQFVVIQYFIVFNMFWVIIMFVVKVEEFFWVVFFRCFQQWSFVFFIIFKNGYIGQVLYNSIGLFWCYVFFGFGLVVYIYLKVCVGSGCYIFKVSVIYQDFVFQNLCVFGFGYGMDGLQVVGVLD